MPIRAILCPMTGQEVTFEEAPEHFERLGLMPAEQVQALIDQENQHRRLGTNLSPSIMHAETNCRREIALRKFVSYLANPVDQWEMSEGTIWHAAMRQAGNKVPGWEREVLLPDPDNPDHVSNPHYQVDEHGRGLIEVFPGILTNGIVDGLRDDKLVIKDLKTKRYPHVPGKKDATPRDWGISEDWVTQVNVYRRLVEILYHDGEEKVEELRVWRQYRGSKRRDLTFRCFGKDLPRLDKDNQPIYVDDSLPILPNGELEKMIREHNDTTVSWLNACLVAKKQAEAKGEDPEPAILEVIKDIPMDGIPMFRGQKCHQWCAADIKRICYGMADFAVF